MRQGAGRWMGLFLIVALAAASLPLVFVSPAKALSVSDYFSISYQINLSQSYVSPGETFTAHITGAATYKQAYVINVTSARISGHVAGYHNVNGVRDGVTKILNSAYTINIDPFPAVGETRAIDQWVDMRFPQGSLPGNYDVVAELDSATVNVWLPATSFLPQSMRSQSMGSVSYDVAPPTPTPGPSPAPTVIPTIVPTATNIPSPPPGGGIVYPTATPTYTPTPSPTPSATPTETPSATAVPTASPTPVVTPGATATATVTATPAASPSPSPMQTITPSPTPAPTAFPAPAPVTLELSDKTTDQGVVKDDITYDVSGKQVVLDIAGGTTVLTKDGSPLQAITAQEVSLDTVPQVDDTVVIGAPYQFGPEGATFDPPITLTIEYDPGLLPAGITGKNLVIAYFDVPSGKWVLLPAEVNEEAHTVSAKVPHFTMFALSADASLLLPSATPTYAATATAVPTATLTPAAPGSLALFSVTGLKVSPAEVKPGKAVEITMTVINDEGSAGDGVVALTINGTMLETRPLTLAAGGRQTVKFITMQSQEGSYAVNIGGQTGHFDVVASSAHHVWWWAVAATAVVIILGGAVVALVKRRKGAAKA